MNSVHALALDGAHAPARVREVWALTENEQERVYKAAREAGAGVVLLSTCHRIEFYVDGDAAFLHDTLALLRPGEDAAVLTTYHGADAAQRLLRVAAGLNSAVLGEMQVLGQVRQAREQARRAGTLTPSLRALFEQAATTGRQIRAQTDLGKGAASVASAAVMLAHRAPGGLRGRNAIVVGAGEMGRLLLKHLPSAQPSTLTLVSRAGTSQVARVAAPEALAALLETADVIFTATNRRVLTAQALAACTPRPRTVIDLGLPRNVAPEVDSMPGVTRYDIDAVGRIVDRGRQQREAAVPEAEALVERGLETFYATISTLQQEAVVGDLRRKAERIRRESVDYVCGKCATPTCRTEPEAGCSNPEYFSRTLTNRLLHDLTDAIRQQRNVDPAWLRSVLGLDTHA